MAAVGDTPCDGFCPDRPLARGDPGGEGRRRLAAMPHFQGDSETELVRVIDDIGLVVPYYLLMHRDMQHTPRVRAFADFVSSEFKSFRALLSNGNVAGA